MSSAARVLIIFSMDSICHSVWGPSCCHVRVLVQRSPPVHVRPEPSSLLAQAAPHPPRQHITVTRVNIARHSRKFQEKLNSYIYRFFFKARKHHYNNLRPTSTKAPSPIGVRFYLLYTLLKMCSQAVSDWLTEQRRKEHIYQLQNIFQLAKEHWRCSSSSRKTWLWSCQQWWHSPSCTLTADRSWESTGRCGEVDGPVPSSSALERGDNMSTWGAWILAQYSLILLGFWHESKNLAGGVSIKSLTRLKLKVSGWSLTDGEARVGERCIQTSMGRSAEYAHCNLQRGVCPCYGAHHYHQEITIFPAASHHRVLQQQEEAQISRDLAHPGKWASERNWTQQGSRHGGHTFLHGITPPVSTARTVICIS